MISVVSATLIIALSTLTKEVQGGWAWGRCPRVQLVGNFDVQQYSGKWYEHARDKATWYQNGDCVQAKYTAQDDGSIAVRNSQRRPGNADPTVGRPGRSTCESSGQCWVRFFSFDKNDYSVVDSDFTSYAIVKNCENWLFGLFRWEIYWILVRDPNAAASVTDVAEASLASRSPHYDQAKNHIYTNRGGNCPYLD